jgi:hypothetical protein
MLELIKGLGEMFVWWSMVFVHVLESTSLFLVCVSLPVIVSISNNSVSWLPVVVRVSLIVVQVGEGSSVTVTQL